MHNVEYMYVSYTHISHKLIEKFGLQQRGPSFWNAPGKLGNYLAI